MRWRRAGLIGLAVVLLSGLIGSRRPAWVAADAPLQATVAASAARAAPSASQTPPASAAAAARTIPGEEARSELARRMKADWCGFGAAELNRQTEAVFEKSTATTGGIGMEALAEARETVAGQLMEETQAEVLRRWVTALIQRGDERSLAVADYLGGANAGDASPVTRARLHARARLSNDPMVTALALQRPCATSACNNIEASQWSRLEPANLQAWLVLVGDPAGKARQTHASYVLDRLAQEARYSRTYQQEFKALLLSLPQTKAPGLQNEAEIQLIYGVVSAWHIPSMRPLMEICRGSLADAGAASRCEAVAQLLWQQDDQMNRALGLVIARSLVAARPALRPHWEPQAREYEAVTEWTKGSVERVVKRLVPEATEAVSPCAVQVEARRMLQEFLPGNEWERLRAEMRDAGEDMAALAARWRKQEGRSALDPRPPTPPALVPALAG